MLSKSKKKQEAPKSLITPTVRKNRTLEKVPPINFDELYEKVKNLLNKDRENFMLLSYSDVNNYFVIVHKKTLTTKSINENNVFQPVTFEKTQDFPIPFILWVSYTKDEPEFIKDMRKFNTTIIKCLPMDDFKEKIQRIVLRD